MPVLIHLVNEEEHGYVELDAQHLADIGKAIEEHRVVTAEVYRYDVSLMLDTLGDECLLPGDVLNHAVDFPGAQSCWEHHHVVVAGESRLHHCWEVAALRTSLVDADAQGSESWQVH